MKCDELKQYEVFVSNPYNTGGGFREIAVLPADKVDEAIAELKAENKLLKEHIANGDVSRITWIDEVIELKQKLDKAIAERDRNQVCIDALQKKLENVQASMYCDVDANMEVRRLKRALYKALTNWAHFAVAFFSSYATKEKWSKMERKCLKKAEEYK